MEQRIFVLDTNILLHNPHSLYGFEEASLIIPDVVLDELDRKKQVDGELGANARTFIRLLESERERSMGKTLLEDVELHTGGTVRVETGYRHVVMPECWRDNGDLRILQVCVGLQNAHRKTDNAEVVLVSNDTIMRIKADVLGIHSERLLNESAPTDESQYKGRREILISSEDFQKLVEHSSIECPLEIWDNSNEDVDPDSFVENEFLTVGNPMAGTLLAVYQQGRINDIGRTMAYCPLGLEAKNTGQRFMLNGLKRSAKDNPLLICIGPAGTGKTLLALAAGLDQVQQGLYRRILYLRANSKLDDDIGFLPGTEEEKMDWALRPVRDSLGCIFAKKSKGTDAVKKDEEVKLKIDGILKKGQIAIEAVAHMRGRSLADTFVIIDEAQNMTPRQLKTLLSRTSETSKIVLMGDPAQIDKAFLDSRTNGLSVVADKMKGSDLVYQVTMLPDECERSRLAHEIASRI